MTWWRRLVGRSRLEAELDAELRDHMARLAADHERAGLVPDEARRLARLSFGGADPIKEACRDVRGTRWLEDVVRDIRLAVRALSASRSFTAIALLVLALSIGASTAIFSVVDAVVLQALPFDEADRLVAIGETSLKRNNMGVVAPQNFLDWKSRQDVFTDMAAIAWGGLTLKGRDGQEPETLFGRQVTANFFTILRTPPVLGRLFTVDNEVDGRARVALISYGLWQRRFGGAIDVIGKRLPGQLGDIEIVGVMPRGFSYPVGSRDATDVWMPFVVPPEGRVRDHDFSYYLQVIARLRDGISIGRAQARMDQIEAGMALETPSWFEGRGVRVESMHTFVTGYARTWMLLLLGAVGCVLLIAIVNLATLTLVRATTRGRELGIRSALGASRWDLARGLLVESLVLALAGAGLGVVVAWAGVDILRSAMPAAIPRVANIAISFRVLGATIVTAIITGLACGVAPVLQFTRRKPAPSLHERGRANTAGAERQRLRTVLVTAEVALAVILLVGSALFLTSFARVTGVDLGIDAHDVLTVRIRPLVGPREVQAALQQNRARLTDVLDRVRTIPGIEVASMLDGGLPFRGDLKTADVSVPGRTLPPDFQEIDRNQISPEYFKALHVPLRQGRLFADTDRDGGEPVVIFNDAAARAYFPNDDPIGQIVNLDGPRRIIGIVGNIRHSGPESDFRREAFVPLAQSRVLGGTLVVRTSQPLSVVLPSIKAAIWTQFPDLALPDISTLDQYLDNMTAQRRVSMLLIGVFGLLGLCIAAVGIYGVMAYVVTQRTQEIGIRMALGAVPATILWSVLQRASRQLLGGLVLGLAGAWWLGGLVGDFLFRVGPHDTVAYLGAAGVLAVVGLLAALLPARRAAGINPIIALRSE